MFNSWDNLINSHTMTCIEKARFLRKNYALFFNKYVKVPNSFIIYRVYQNKRTNNNLIKPEIKPKKMWSNIISWSENKEEKFIAILKDKSIGNNRKKELIQDIPKNIIYACANFYIPSSFSNLPINDLVDILIQISNRKYTKLFDVVAVHIINNGDILLAILNKKYPMSTDVVEYLMENHFDYINFTLPYKTIEDICNTVLERFKKERREEEIKQIVEERMKDYDDYYLNYNDEDL